MIHNKGRNLNILFGFFFCFSLFPGSYAQNSIVTSDINYPEDTGFVQDTSAEIRRRNERIAGADTNFTWDRYADFLKIISDTSRYIVLPLNEFRQTFRPDRVVIGLRHDVDNDLYKALYFSEIEWKFGFRSTYFILHTSPYYMTRINDISVHNQNIIPLLKTMQDERKCDIGWHNDLVTLQLFYKTDPVSFLHNELSWLRGNGIKISGTSAHGSHYCKEYHYMNYYFFHDFTFPSVPGMENNIYVPVDHSKIPIKKGYLSDFDLKYEAYFLNNNVSYSDATFIDGLRWNPGMLDPGKLKAGDRVIILLHPVHWHKTSELANFEIFRIPGQISSAINFETSEISVEMPYGTNCDSLKATFLLSPGAVARVAGKLQESGRDRNNFSKTVIYDVRAEKRSCLKSWRVIIHNAKNNSCDFKSYSFPGITKSVFINLSAKTVLMKVQKHADLSRLTPEFELSPGATAWIDGNRQVSDSSVICYSGTLNYKVIAEDGTSSCNWIITIQFLNK